MNRYVWKLSAAWLTLLVVCQSPQVRADETIEFIPKEALNQCLAAKKATQVQLEDLQLVSTKQKEMIGTLSSQRIQAYAKAEAATSAGPVPWYVPAGGGAVAGIAVTTLVLILIRGLK